MAGHGLADHIMIAAAEEMTEHSGAEACLELMKGPDRPTAIFAANDMMAIGALTAADNLGLPVPQKVSIVGYDNTSIASIGRIALTTIDNVSYEIGRRGAERLKLRMQGGTTAPVTEILPPRLVLRHSTSRPL